MKRNVRSRRSSFVLCWSLGWAGIAAAALSGCISEPGADAAAQASETAKTLAAGETLDRLATGATSLYEVDVPAGKTLRVSVRSLSGTPLDLGAVRMPDGRVVEGVSIARASVLNSTLRIAPLAESETTPGFQFAGQINAAGRWQFSVTNQRAADLQALDEARRDKSVLENFLLIAYLLNQGRDFTGENLLEGLVRSSFPQATAIPRPLDVVFDVEFVTAEEAANHFPETSGNGGSNSTGDNAGGNTGGNNTGGNTGGDTGNSNSGGNSAGGQNAGGGDNTGGSSNNGNSGGSNSGDNTGGDNSGGSNQGDNNGGGTGDSNGGSGGNTDGNGGGQSGGGGTTPPPPPPATVALERIVQSGDPVPDQPASAKFVHFGDPITDGAGRIAFWASYSGGRGNSGLYVWDGVLKRVVDDSPQRVGSVPERGPSDYFGDFNVQPDSGALPMAWGANGRLLFSAPSKGSGNWRGLYRWRATDGDLIRVADLGQIAALFPEALANTFSCDFLQPGVSDAGIALFTVRYTYIKQDRSFVLGKRGVFTSNGFTVSLVADPLRTPAGSVPDQGPAAFFDQFEALSTLNTAGDMLCQGAYVLGAGDRGIYLATGGGLYRVLDNAPGRAFPGLPTGAVVGQAGQPFEGFAIGGNGAIAVDTKLTVGGATRDAVLYWDNQQWRELAGLDGAPSAALLSGLNQFGQTLFLAGDKPYLFTGTDVLDLTAALPPELQTNDLRWEPFGGALNNNGRALLRFTRTAGGATPGLAVWNGEKLLVAADAALGSPTPGLRQFLGVRGPELDRAGRSGAWNDRDELVFRASAAGQDGQDNTNDDTQAIYVGRLR